MEEKEYEDVLKEIKGLRKAVRKIRDKVAYRIDPYYGGMFSAESGTASTALVGMESVLDILLDKLREEKENGNGA